MHDVTRIVFVLLRPRWPFAPARPPALAQNLPFTVTQVADFDIPWAMAFLPDGRMLVTEQRGMLKLYTPGGASVDVRGVPRGQLVRPGRLGRRRAASRLREQRARVLELCRGRRRRDARRGRRAREARARRQRRRAAEPASHLAAIAEGRGRRPLQPPHRVRRRLSVDQLRRAPAVRSCAGHEHEPRQDAAAQRGRQRAARQSVRGPRRRDGADLVARPSQPARPRVRLRKAGSGTSRWGRWAATS